MNSVIIADCGFGLQLRWASPGGGEVARSSPLIDDWSTRGSETRGAVSRSLP